MRRLERHRVVQIRRRLAALGSAFCLGALLSGWLMIGVMPGSAPWPDPWPPMTPPTLAPVVTSDTGPPADPAPLHDTTDAPVVRPGDIDATAPATGTEPVPGSTATTGAAAHEAAVNALRAATLLVPVDGVARDALRDTFADRRGSARAHEAIDIMAPRGRPVVAAQDGTIQKLFTSEAGGLTVYQFDADGTFCFYYAHLDRYATGLAEGQAVRRGQVIGYVGSTGNASPDAPHLHFAIFRLTPERQWWQGEPVNPYPVLR